MSNIPQEINNILDDLSLLHSAYFERYGSGKSDLSDVRIDHNPKYNDWTISINQETLVGEWVQNQIRMRNIQGSFDNQSFSTDSSYTNYNYKLSFRPEDAEEIHDAVLETIQTVPTLPARPVYDLSWMPS